MRVGLRPSVCACVLVLSAHVCAAAFRHIRLARRGAAGDKDSAPSPPPVLFWLSALVLLLLRILWSRGQSHVAALRFTGARTAKKEKIGLSLGTDTSAALAGSGAIIARGRRSAHAISRSASALQLIVGREKFANFERSKWREETKQRSCLSLRG